MTKSRCLWDIIFAIFMILLSSLVIWESGKTFDPGFDPLGPTLVPKVLAASIVVLSICLILTRARTLFLIPKDHNHKDKGSDVLQVRGRQRYGLAAFAFAWSIAYVFAMDHGITGYVIATFVYVFVLALSFGRLSWRTILLALMVSTIITLGTEFLFTKVFVTGLPT